MKVKKNAHFYPVLCFLLSIFINRRVGAWTSYLRSAHKNVPSRLNIHARSARDGTFLRTEMRYTEKNLAVRRYCVQYISATSTRRDGYPSSRTATLDYGT